MSANRFFIIRPHVGTRGYSWRRTPLREGVGVLLFLLLPLGVVLCASGLGFAQSTLIVVDNEPIDPEPGEPGPGDNMVFSVPRNTTYVVALSFTTGQPGEIVTHRMDKGGELEFVDRTPAERESRQIAMARKGDYAVVVNSIDDECEYSRSGTMECSPRLAIPWTAAGITPTTWRSPLATSC